MASDQEIASCVESLLLRQPSDAGGGASVTVHGVVQQVEAKLGLDLSHKASFIRNHINLLLHHQHQQQQQQQQQQQLHPQHQNQQQHHHPIPHLQPQQQQQHYYPSHLLGQISPQQQQQSPFGNLPQRHELAFRCVQPPPQMIPHQQNPQKHHHPHPQQNVQVAATSAQKTDAAGATPKASQTGAKRRGGPGGLSKVCGVSPELQAIVGEPAMPRTQIVKQLWAYIRKHNLQDPNNKRKIVCNDELRLVFETDCTDMFKMNKLLAKHIIPLEPTKESGPDSKRPKASETAPIAKSEPAECSAIISEALAGFFEIEEREMLQSEALKQVWNYIKTNQLEDPLNSMVVCDSKLQQLFGCEKLSSVEVSEMVSQHFIKQ